MGSGWSQMFPPNPTLTESNLPRQDGKVFVITGGAAGVGFELCRILYQAGAKVYIAGRSQKNGEDAIQKIKNLSTATSDPGSLHFLRVDLSDLASIKPAIEDFTSRETRLDVLVNNAGVATPPAGTLSPQGYDIQLATNCIGPYLFTQLLLPMLRSTAKQQQAGAVRVVWTSSLTVDFMAPQSGGLDLESLNNFATKYKPDAAYPITKLGNWYLAHTLSEEVTKDGILSVTQNPGNLKTLLTRHRPSWFQTVISPLLYGAVYGAYTELWCATSPELTISDGGVYVMPWGRRHPNLRKDLVKGLRSPAEGGNGMAKDFETWCEEQVKKYR